MEIGGWVLLAVLWAVVNMMTRRMEKPPGSQRREPRNRPSPNSPPFPQTLDPSQAEGTRLEVMLRELQRALEQGIHTGPLGRPANLPLPENEEFEERTSLEVEPEVLSLETEVRRESRQLVDQDDAAEAIEARRVGAAAARDKAVTQADHSAFDQRIRQEVADKTAVRYTPQQLRDAIVWREILGPPVSLREGER
jgi:hypothetical protein